MSLSYLKDVVVWTDARVLETYPPQVVPCCECRDPLATWKIREAGLDVKGAQVCTRDTFYCTAHLPRCPACNHLTATCICVGGDTT